VDISEWLAVTPVVIYMNVSRKHPQNPDGRFWIDQDVCMFCKACIYEAPENIRFDDAAGMSYVFKQPETAEELRAVQSAIHCCPVEAVVDIEQ
jgi:ferredoxin